MDYYDSFTRYCLSHGASITPLSVGSEDSAHLGLCNPSVLLDGDTVRIVIRNVNFALWACDNPYRFTSPHGPLCYMTKVDDNYLRTRNFLCELDSNGLAYKLIDTKANDYPPKFEMAGHEDMRLVRWDGKLYGTGVQRDWHRSGTGRMHLSELDPGTGRELSRARVKAPGRNDTYCEKNWMPILDMPFHYVKWCDPLVVVRTDPKNGKTEVVLEREIPEGVENRYFERTDIRGSSQVVEWGEYRVALVHRCQLWMNEKNQKSDTNYFMQFIVWDRDWNVVRMSRVFKFAQFGIEFTNGLAYRDGKFLIPFALQDNMCFLMSVDEGIVRDFIFGEAPELGSYSVSGSPMMDFFRDTTDSESCALFGNTYYGEGHYAASFVCYARACEYNTFRRPEDLYECMYWCGMSLAMIGGMDVYEKSVWLRMIDLNPFRSEGYLMMAKYCYSRGWAQEAHTFSKLAYMKNNYGFADAEEFGTDGMILYFKTMYDTENYNDSVRFLSGLLDGDRLNDWQREDVSRFVKLAEESRENRYRVL